MYRFRSVQLHDDHLVAEERVGPGPLERGGLVSLNLNQICSEKKAVVIRKATSTQNSRYYETKLSAFCHSFCELFIVHYICKLHLCKEL